MNPIGLIMRSVFQLQNINKSLAATISEADQGGQTIAATLATKTDTPQNRNHLRHLIGIERWGQRRLKTMLNEPPIQDEYDGYQPAETLDLAALRDDFARTRAETIALARTIEQQGLANTAKANHNMMGDISLNTWLRYLVSHANFEAKSVK